ncbi:hypothetical protein ACNVED_05935 [Legionella sp. D16C41]|uniref:hypothetical protein n=1 Tax=Legionella sp. D16C41 TaxID=3402688 RepID=UPI003AF495BB
MRDLAKINIETLVLVAIWEQPFIFQGCFQIIESISQKKVLYFFRCQYEKFEYINKIDDDFSPYDYNFSYLYDESRMIELHSLTDAGDFAIYVLKYALHTTLLEMLKHERKNFLSIDDMAMQAMIERIRPILDQNLLTGLDEDLGFAASVDFMPQEEMARMAAKALLSNFTQQDFTQSNRH